MNPLLTPKEVANLLRISERTVYDHKEELGGFYPAGIRRLRFKQEVIYGHMEESQTRDLALRVSASREKVHGKRLQNKGRGQSRQRGEKKTGKVRESTDSNRHGLFGGSKSVSRLGATKIRK